MALVATVTKKAVKFAQTHMHMITFNLKVTDGGVNVIDQDFSCEYRTGDAPSQKVPEITKQMQTVIDNYKSEQQIFNAVALNNAVTNIQGGLTL